MIESNDKYPAWLFRLIPESHNLDVQLYSYMDTVDPNNYPRHYEMRSLNRKIKKRKCILGNINSNLEYVKDKDVTI